MNYTDAIAVDGLDRLIEFRWGQWGHLSKEAADACWNAAVYAYPTLHVVQKPTLFECAGMLLFTMADESCFALDCKPNQNLDPSIPNTIMRWDIGPWQSNMTWYQKWIDKGAYQPVTPNLFDWTGQLVLENPQPFNGNVLLAGVACLNMLLAWHGNPEDRCVAYTGQDHQKVRREDFHWFGPRMIQFYADYTEK